MNVITSSRTITLRHFVARIDIDGQPTNVPRVGLADNGAPGEMGIHALYGFAYTGRTDVLSMFARTAEKVGGRWVLKAA